MDAGNENAAKRRNRCPPTIGSGLLLVGFPLLYAANEARPSGLGGLRNEEKRSQGEISFGNSFQPDGLQPDGPRKIFVRLIRLSRGWALI